MTNLSTRNLLSYMNGLTGGHYYSYLPSLGGTFLLATLAYKSSTTPEQQLASVVGTLFGGLVANLVAGVSFGEIDHRTARFSSEIPDGHRKKLHLIGAGLMLAFSLSVADYAGQVFQDRAQSKDYDDVTQGQSRSASSGLPSSPTVE